MKRITKILSILLATLPLVVASQNLVQNPGFEIYSALPVNPGQFALSTNWDNANSFSASPDFLHTNSTGIVQIPNWVGGNVSPYQGDAIMGLVMWASSITDGREYVSQTLATPLTVGSSYTFSFYITNGMPTGYGGWGIQNVQVDFSVNPFVQNNISAFGYTPLLTQSTMVYTNTWTQLTYTFTATQPYAYFAIGNFDNDVNTVVQQFENANWQGAYYYIDEVSLTLSTNNLNIIGDNEICLGDSSVVQAFNSSTYAWADSLNPNVIIDNDSMLVVTPNVTTTYYVYGSNDTASFTVNVTNPGNLNLGGDTALCNGNNLILNASLSNATYLWQDNSTSSTFTVSQPGTYFVTATVNNCSVSDTLTVSYNAPPIINLGNDTTLCQGDNIILDATTLNANYQWQDNSANSIFNVSQQGTYWVKVTVNNCSASDTVIVNYYPGQIINLGNDTSLCEGDQILLDITGSVGTFLWQDNSSNPTFTITQPGLYWVQVVSTNCILSDTIKVESSICETVFQMPNTFTPNNDGINDFFLPFDISTISQPTLEIYNRWGQKILEISDLSKGWDGKSNSNPCPAGIYYWIVNYTNIDNESKTLTGFVTLMN